MARTQAEKKRISQACRELPQSDSHLIVWNLLRMDPSAAEWLSNAAKNWNWDKLERHHIFSRGTKDELNFVTNIIAIYDCCHDYGHDVSPHRLELCCLAAQWKLQQEFDARRELIPLEPHRRFWNIDALNSICGKASLEGRIEVDLIPVVRNTPLEAIGLQLLTDIANDKLNDF